MLDQYGSLVPGAINNYLSTTSGAMQGAIAGAGMNDGGNTSFIGGQGNIMLDPRQQTDLQFRNLQRDTQLQAQALRGQQAYEAQLGNQLNNQRLRQDLIQNAQTNMANNVANQLSNFTNARNTTANLLGNASTGVSALLRR